MTQNNNNLICNGEFEIVKITEDLYDEAVELHQKYFMKYENVSIAANLSGSEESIKEMIMLIKFALRDGISFAARHCESQKLAAMCINKMLHPSTNCGFDEIFNQFKSPEMKSVGQYLERMEGTNNLFKEWNIDCCIELLFLSTRSGFGRRGLAAILSQHSIEYFKKMSKGTLPESENLPAHVRDLKPKAICSTFTSHFSQRIGEKLGFQIITKIPNNEIMLNGKPFAEKIDPIHKYSTFEAIRL